MTSKMTLARAIAKSAETFTAEAEQTRKEAADLALTLPALEQAVQDVRDGVGPVAEVWSALKRGEEITPNRLSEAEAQEKISEKSLAFTAARLGRMTKGLPAESTILADKIATAFQAILPGIDIAVTNAPVQVWRDSVPTDSVGVVLVAENDVQRDEFTSSHSGTVTAYFLRNGYMRPISVQTLEKAAQSKRINLTVSSNRVPDENGWVVVTGTGTEHENDPNSLVMDTLVIRVEGVIDGLPTIPHIASVPGIVKTWVMDLFNGQANDGYTSSTGRVRIDPNPGEAAWIVRFGVSAARAMPIVHSESIEGDERTLTVKQTINVSNIDPGEFVGAINKIAENFVGSPGIGIGILTDVQIDYRNESIPSNHVFDVTLTYKSRTV